jgi:hypothetical protein
MDIDMELDMEPGPRSGRWKITRRRDGKLRVHRGSLT